MSDTSGRRLAAVVVGAIVLRWGWIAAVAPGTSQTLTSPSLAYIAHTQQLQRSTFFGRTVHTATLGVSVAGGPDIWSVTLQGKALDWGTPDGVVWQPDSSQVVFTGRAEDGTTVRIEGPSFPPVKSVEALMDEQASPEAP